ncbi:MAG: ABC transporter ATP-binding protein [Campylobacteraceae bacterium]|jgi:capsular polysaccharide transport system ATP-binding protein|nr:ABC transporter ATP-binding protein [Campylobacteraceae bacterium]
MIRLENLTKSYPLENGRHYVFKNLSFEFPENSNIGLIGPNGAGKTTLMNILGGTDIPDRGRVVTNKSISFPIGFGGGLQGSLSAADNIKFVARVYGFTGERMRQKVEYVRDFAEIGEFFYQPIKTYSSGMKARVSFGLSMAFDFDYYLIDEAGAVGDASFKTKSTAIYKEKLSKSNVIIVSHNMNEIKSLCDHIVVFNAGEAHIFNNVNEGIKMYQKLKTNVVQQ